MIFSLTAVQLSQSVRERPKSMAVPSQGMINLSSTPDLKTYRSSSILSRNEDLTDADNGSVLLYPSLSSAHSVSIESLEDLNYDYDEDIAMKGPEPESWSATMDKKTLKKMNAKDIKRQDHIFELIQTEKHHLRTLKIMQKIFSYGMQHELHMERDLINKMFPSLNELVEIAVSFHNRLKERQSQAKVVECIGDVLVDQFDTESGEKMVKSYSYFCSRQKEAVQTYKDLLKTDRKFQLFIKKCSNNALCRRWSVPECILSAMHRLTKYPLLIHAIIKQTKPSKADYRPLQKAVTCVKSILGRVNEEVQLYEQNKKLWDIYNKVEGRAYGMMKNGKKFEKKDIVSKDRKLRYEGTIQLKSARGKYTEIVGVLLTDVFLLLELNNQKYTFTSQDQKAPVISLHKMMVRDVATDNKSIYLISTASSGPEMYEVKCESDDRKLWKAKIEEAVKECPAPDEDLQVEEVDEQIRLEEVRAKTIKQFISDLQNKDSQIKSLATEKTNLIIELAKVIRNDNSNLRESEEMLYMKSSELLLKSLEEVTHLTSSVCSINYMGLGRSASSAGEHFSGTCQLPALPKRAETFSGFDSSVKDHATFDFGLPGTNLQKRYSRRNSTSENRSSSSPNLSKEQTHSMHSQDTDKGGSDPTLNPDTRSLAGMKMDSQAKSQMGRSLSDAADWKAMKEREKMFAALRRDPNQTIDSDNSQGDLSSSIDSTPGGTTHLPTNETVTATTRLTQYLNRLLVLTADQETELQSLNHQLSDAKMKINELTQHATTLEEKQEEQLNTCRQVELDQEEVHLMQQKLREERQEFEEEKEKLQTEIENQNLLFTSQQQLLVKETTEKERLQKQIETMELQLKDLKEQVKSSKNIKEERGDKWKLAKENNNQSNNSGRKPRSYSDMSLRDVVEGSEKSSLSSDSEGGSSRRNRNDKAVPIHLLSATNELDTSSDIKQKLPFKLSSLSSSTTSLQGKRHSSSSSIGTSSSVPPSSGSALSSLSSKRHLSSSSIGLTNTTQMLPMKLANLSSTASEKKSNHRKSKKDYSSLENNGKAQAKHQGEQQQQDVIYF
ncbi:rho guanine nucleotide exchange factor 18-like [Anneissia japonica]|uniref:rho guanine nucleotide exchange factor 18-like n=1 Tax=Anneissia japonica TaxID=1529436 RepID=UPI001425AE95|nr:rho guanine nucleotide exchange factor 18-like [Anneissia japonica]